MFSYKVFLTKSSEAAYAIAQGINIGSGAAEARIHSVKNGMVNQDTHFVPAVYQNQGFFYCVIESITDSTKPATYQLTVC